MIEPTLASRLDLDTGVIHGGTLVQRRLSDLKGVFADSQAYERAAAKGDPVIYTVSSVEPAHGSGQLHYALAALQPGKVGQEYYLTKGHFHAWREAAEVYIGFRGQGLMLLEDEQTRESRVLPLNAHGVVYVPGRTAHRTINVGNEPLIYLGVYCAGAGHDYGAIAQRNFGQVVIDQNGCPVTRKRSEFNP
jgi:glucose-6-phosphate isomerase